jgi:hypothetical protein
LRKAISANFPVFHEIKDNDVRPVSPLGKGKKFPDLIEIREIRQIE